MMVATEANLAGHYAATSPPHRAAAPRHHCTARDANISVPKDIFLQAPEFSS